MGKWHDREGDIRKLVSAGLTDAQIGAVFGVSAVTMCNVRKELGIPSQFKRKPTFGRPLEPPPPLVGEVYTDAEGLTVTRYPARYAAGVGGLSVTARPRR